MGSKSIWKTKAEGSFEKSAPGGKVQLSPGILTVSIHSSCPYSYEKASHLLCMSAPEVSLVSASSHCTASRAWCQGWGQLEVRVALRQCGRSSSTKAACPEHAGAASLSPGGQLCFGPGLFSEADPLPPAILTPSQWNLLSLKIIQVNRWLTVKNPG